MLCMLCGAEMRLMKVEQAETMTVIGYEFHTFECSSCQDIERRLTFTHEPTPQPDQLALVDTATPAAPPSSSRDTALPAFPISPTSADKDEAAPPVSPRSVDNTDAALPEAPTLDRDNAAPPASTGQHEAAPQVSQQVKDPDFDLSLDLVASPDQPPRRSRLHWEPEQAPRMARSERMQWLLIAGMTVVVLVLMILHIWR
jgi:hypothetical protein